MFNRKAFTLSELLLALAIVGTLAALSIPNVIENMNRKIMGDQLKNTSLAIQNIVNEQLVKHNTKNIKDTDFASPTKLLSDSNFSIVSTSACYPTGSTEPTNCFDKTSKSIDGKDPVDFNNVFSRHAIKLKNGVAITYSRSTITSSPHDPAFGIFWVDLNGNAKPNILGRDLFVFRITEKGRLINGSGVDNLTDTKLEDLCKDGTGYSTACYSLVERNNWKITY